jgi:hypothetical protein
MASAARWYARAALGGHDRAAFALGRLLASGDGLPRNPGFAAGWLEQAARSIPAAADALASLAADEAGLLSAPEPLAFQIREEGSERWAEVAWVAETGPTGAGFRLEIMAPGEDGSPGGLVAVAETRGGAVRVPVPGAVTRLVWRVVMIDREAGDYSASQWYDDALQAAPVQNAGLVSFLMSPDSARAAAVADFAAEPLREAGLRVDHRTVPDAPEISAVRYRYVADAPLARDIARFLPALRAADATLDPTLDAQPGEIVVVLAFD